ncbi:MAG: TRAFs-binding domain-containing protein [Cytophagales bacterium]|nr:TRAFs-binding domain-containing protein [Cytophagales bacterium]
MTESLDVIQDLINHGRYFEARARAESVIQQDDSLRLKQLFALAVSKSGSHQLAPRFFTAIYAANPGDSETAGILGGIYKDLFKKHQDSKYAILSRDTYAKNFEATGNYYTGINAATMAAIAGRAVQGREIAAQVISKLEGQANSVWELATLGEAYLLTKNRNRSVEYYIKARKLVGNDWGKVLSIHNQLWLLNHYLPVAKEILRIFAPPIVLAFAGHMVDAPNRSTPRFPASIEGKVKDSIKGAIRTLQASIGYCSLACGADILLQKLC